MWYGVQMTSPAELKHSLESFEPQDVDEALDLLFDKVDRWLTKSQFDTVDEFISMVDVEKLSEDLLIGVLSITFPARSKLPARTSYMKRLESCLDISALRGL